MLAHQHNPEMYGLRADLPPSQIAAAVRRGAEVFSAAAAGDAGGSDAVGTATASMLGLCEMAGEPSAELWERYLRGSDALEQGEGAGQQDADEPVQAALCALGLLSGRASSDKEAKSLVRQELDPAIARENDALRSRHGLSSNEAVLASYRCLNAQVRPSRITSIYHFRAGMTTRSCTGGGWLADADDDAHHLRDLRLLVLLGALLSGNPYQVREPLPLGKMPRQLTRGLAARRQTTLPLAEVTCAEKFAGRLTKLDNAVRFETTASESVIFLEVSHREELLADIARQVRAYPETLRVETPDVGSATPKTSLRNLKSLLADKSPAAATNLLSGLSASSGSAKLSKLFSK